MSPNRGHPFSKVSSPLGYIYDNLRLYIAQYKWAVPFENLHLQLDLSQMWAASYQKSPTLWIFIVCSKYAPAMTFENLCSGQKRAAVDGHLAGTYLKKLKNKRNVRLLMAIWQADMLKSLCIMYSLYMCMYITCNAGRQAAKSVYLVLSTYVYIYIMCNNVRLLLACV